MSVIKKVTHNVKRSGAHKSWATMVANCLNRNRPSYSTIGGKGIKFDPRWREYKEFHKDMGDRPEGMQLCRRDTSKNYDKDNCIWATPDERKRRHRPGKSKLRIKDPVSGELTTVPDYAVMVGKGKSYIYTLIREGKIEYTTVEQENVKQDSDNRG